VAAAGPLVIALLAALAAQLPQAPARVAHPASAQEPPAIDGRLDDAAWRSAPPLDGFVQREPREGSEISERTEVRVVVTGEALYIGAWLFDRTPELIVEGERIRDAELATGDYFGFLLDTFLDRQNGFVFATTPAGIEYDGQVIREGEGGGTMQQGQSRQQAGAMGGFNLNWDATWQVATRRDSLGWYAEFRIPFSTLRYTGSGRQTWGVNFVRGIRRRNEESFWAPVPRQYNLMRVSRAGTLEGLEVPARRAATISPYVLGRAEREYQVQSGFERRGEVGADAKFGLSSSLVLDLTYNTDFAQVEVDEQQTNLTRFPLFFPEKRPFFLENGGTFSAGTPQSVELFFSRRIGIAPDGRPVPITGGGRLTGRVAGTTVGLLQLFTDDVAGGPGENSYSVVRVIREAGRSRFGAIAVQRLALDSSDNLNRTYGADGRLRLGEAVTIDAWAALTETPNASGDQAAWSTRGAYLTRDWSIFARFTQVGPSFNPEVGFLGRAAYRGVETNVMRFIRVPSRPWIRQLNPHLTTRGFWDFDGFQETGYLHFDGELEFAGGGRFGPEFNFAREGLRDSFEIAPGVVIPPGRYDWFSNGWDFGTNPSAPLSISGRLDLGEFYGGHRWGGSATVTARRGAGFTAALSWSPNAVRLPQGRFTTQLIGARLGWFFTPRIFVQSLVQYNSRAGAWFGNVRFGWLSTAGTGLYVVLNDLERAPSATDITGPLGRSLTVKYTHQLQL